VALYQPVKGHGSVAKLVFTGRKTVAINLPFTLEDVKLP
jgi:hypothetical protein